MSFFHCPACTRLKQLSTFSLLLISSNALLASAFEPKLIDSLNALQFQTDAASENKLAALIEEYPNSQTAHLLMGDLLAARAGFVDPNSLRTTLNKTTQLQQLDGLREELRLRWNQKKHLTDVNKGKVPASIIQLAKNKPNLVFVDAANARLYVFNNIDGRLSLSHDNYTSIGEKGMHKRLEGDERTPIGVYHVTSYIEDKDLPPRYGTGAFPINYPNELDKKNKRTGYGIWLHGTHPDSFNRIPLASDGCVAMSNPELDLLKPLIKPSNKTPVLISNKVQWVLPEDLNLSRQFFNDLLDTWVADWESLDSQRYLRHYDESFFSPKHDYTGWAARKTAVITGKTSIKVNLSNISLFAYPGENDMVVAEFSQRYQSNNFDSNANKRQYWQRQNNGDWKIIYEGPQ